jgi:hypothetical protein
VSEKQWKISEIGAAAQLLPHFEPKKIFNAAGARKRVNS